jgi:hypothetical protein
MIENLVGRNEKALPLNENDDIKFAKQSWQLKLCHQTQATQQLMGPPHLLAQLDFIFELSLDEEQTCLKVVTKDETIDFHARIHHYLILNLARYRSNDAKAGLDSQQQGWVYPEQLMRDIGLDYSHLNILVHRARKQLSDALDVSDGQSFVERNAGKLRFGASKFKIIKGQQLECELTT